ncbi:MAG: hypothetical protein KF778_03555 [Rhodocyclaceae bacterium]|nr:hypothetical protein [Rhodocyclaceae bacterium]MBX3667455.1 hypothetical protein [Rhodocyclaceae bacterium]
MGLDVRPAMRAPAGDDSAKSGAGSVNTGGGSYVGGNVQAGEFVGRDKIVNEYVAGDKIVMAAPLAPPEPPFQVPRAAADLVARTRELTRLRLSLLDDSKHLLPNTVGLCGFGGFGKTTLAKLFCADPDVIAACSGGTLWVPLGKHPADARAQIADLVSALTGSSAGCATLAGAQARLQQALSGRAVLVVIDDVWDEAALRPIAEASSGCARLITTRNPDTLPLEAELIDIASMDAPDAAQLLSGGLPAGEAARLDALAQRLGGWPVLLRLANRALRQSLRQKVPLARALDGIEDEIRKQGVVAFDPQRDVAERDQAVAATVGASLAELPSADERARCAELAIFPQDVPIPLVRAAELWQLTAGYDAARSRKLVTSLLDPLSLVDFDGGADTLALHDVLRSFFAGQLENLADLHASLAVHWGERPPAGDAYAWRWLAFHRARAAALRAGPARHADVAALVELTGNAEWQAAQLAALQDLPALAAALNWSLDAALADDTPAGVPLVVAGADNLVRFRLEHLRPGPMFELARRGELDAARRRAALFDIDEHWRQALLLALVWLAPPHCRAEARALFDEIRPMLAAEAALHDLAAWVDAALKGAAPPRYPIPRPLAEIDPGLVEEILKRVGGGAFDREMLLSRNLDAGTDPDRPPTTLGVASGARGDAKVRYLAEVDAPVLVSFAALNAASGTAALARYLSVYTNYSYAEYRYASLWILLAQVVRAPDPPGAGWVQDAVVRVIEAALAGGSVEFDQGLAVVVRALRAGAGDHAAQTGLQAWTTQLLEQARALQYGRDPHASDVWGGHKRDMLAHAQALGWLLGMGALAEQLLAGAAAISDSGFAGYQAPACLALAETLFVCRGNAAAAATDIESAYAAAQHAAHNVQDASFCARMTARVQAMRRYWQPGFDLPQRAARLPDAAHLPEFAALHRVGHDYAGRRGDALELPDWAREDASLEGLARLYQRPVADFRRINASAGPFLYGDAVAVPDPGLLPHIAARLAAETLARMPAGAVPQELHWLKSFVRAALPSQTALDAVLSRLVLATARGAPPALLLDLAAALDGVLARRPPPAAADAAHELIAGRLPA